MAGSCPRGKQAYLFIYSFIYLFLPPFLEILLIDSCFGLFFPSFSSSSFIKINRLAPSLSDLLRSSRGEKIEIVACR